MKAETKKALCGWTTKIQMDDVELSQLVSMIRSYEPHNVLQKRLKDMIFDHYNNCPSKGQIYKTNH